MVLSVVFCRLATMLDLNICIVNSVGLLYLLPILNPKSYDRE